MEHQARTKTFSPELVCPSPRLPNPGDAQSVAHFDHQEPNQREIQQQHYNQVTLALLLKLSTKAALSKASSTFLGEPPTAAVASATLTSLAAMSMGQESGRQFTHSCALFKAVEKKVHISHYSIKTRKARIFKLIKHFHWIFN